MNASEKLALINKAQTDEESRNQIITIYYYYIIKIALSYRHKSFSSKGNKMITVEDLCSSAVVAIIENVFNKPYDSIRYFQANLKRYAKNGMNNYIYLNGTISPGQVILRKYHRLKNQGVFDGAISAQDIQERTGLSHRKSETLFDAHRVQRRTSIHDKDIPRVDNHDTDNQEIISIIKNGPYPILQHLAEGKPRKQLVNGRNYPAFNKRYGAEMQSIRDKIGA